MAPPPALRNARQTQSITTTLRNICDAYPPNTCLRELLQNADDAKATEIEFVLDTTTYDNEPLIHPDLRGYHGPALLARNNSVFTAEDFNSLSSVGDSAKRLDLATTGKFGQGFNSVRYIAAICGILLLMILQVYHWTDGPWIYSARSLLLLDPHEGWSRSQGHLAGGPMWDVVDNHQSHELLNHLKTFSRFDFDPKQILKQTFVRMPLRTEDQAATSKIRPGKEVKTANIRHALEKFSQDIKGGDLLFLKHLRSITIRIDDEIMLSSKISTLDAQAKSIHDGLPGDFLNLYKPSGPNTLHDVTRNFQTNVTHVDVSGSWTDEYIISHLMKPSSDNVELDAWGRGLKLLPWVAVAAPLRVREKPFEGKLFSTLSLHLKTQQPVHIHGLFAIGPDRARLGFDDLEVQWNRYMFETCVADAWSRLLEYRNNKSPSTERFSLWPRADLTIKSEDPWTSLGTWVTDLVLQQRKRVWNTTAGTSVPFAEGLFTFNGTDSANYQESWAGIRLPGVILDTSHFQLLMERLRNHNDLPTILSPRTVRDHLRKGIPIPDQMIASVLEYCLLDIIRNEYTESTLGNICRDLCSMRLWRMLSGDLVQVSLSHPVLLPRDDGEEQLFKSSRSDSTLAVNAFTPKVRAIMSGVVVHSQTIARFRKLEDLEFDWPNMFQPVYSNAKNSAVASRIIASDPILTQIWTWICARFAEEGQKVPPSLGSLWLLPLQGEEVRRLRPIEDIAPALILEEQDLLNEVISELSLQNLVAEAAIVDTSVLSKEITYTLKSSFSRIPGMRLAHQGDLLLLVDWLASAENMIQKTSNEHKKIILHHLAKLLQLCSFRNFSSITNKVRRLHLFTRSIASVPYVCWNTTKSSMSQVQHIYEIPKDLPALPEMDGLAFFNLSDSNERYIVQKLSLIPDASTETLLDRYFLPWLSAELDSSLQEARLRLIDWIFWRSKTPTQAWKVLVSSRPIVPKRFENEVQSFAILTDLVDPKSPYTQLYYEDEDVFPSQDFFKKHYLAARACGLKNGTESSTFLLDRARTYAQHTADEQLKNKISCLLTVPIQQCIPESTVKCLRSLRWFPARSPEGRMELYAPSQCRGSAQQHLVDNIWGITDFNIPPQWHSLLGWDHDVPQDILLAQLESCIKQHEITKVKKLLSSFKPSQYSALVQRSCILGYNGNFMLPNKVYTPGRALVSARMTPYIDRVDAGFASSLSDLLSAIGVREEPSVEDLRAVQAVISPSAQEHLDKNGLQIAVASLEAACYMGYDPNNLRIPDTSGVLRDLADVVQGEVVDTGKMDHFNFTHPTISMDLLCRLHVETAYERATRLNLEIEDEDDDEYAPREKLSNIICDTLGRYPVDTTFNEFLANADDAGALQICWTIDKCQKKPFASEALLSTELKPLQGPSLIVYNDSVFSDKDFAGFKEIGQGGKQDDATTTGMFGRGAMTMYHFTDVPMLISGAYFLILDPQQELLPRNKKTLKRKIGVKAPLSRVRKFARDSLEPFNGMHGYNKDMDYFDGTIFRFPFREPASKTYIRDSVYHLDAHQTENLLDQYWSTARSSLLFLHNVRSIEVRIRGEEAPKWSVSALRPEGSEGEVFRSIIISNHEEDKKPWYDLWRIGRKDIDSSPPHIQKLGKGSSKITECGVAACLQYDQSDKPGFEAAPIISIHTGSRKTEAQQRVFCMLPTSFASQLPISFHASFAITGDRKTITFENQDPLAAWNRWLLEDCIPELYIEFLRDAAPRYGPEAFQFWPKKLSSRDITLSSIVAESFWTKAMGESHSYDQLYPVSILERSVDDAKSNNLRRPMARGRRTLHTVTNLRKAHFDFLDESESLVLRPLFHKLSLNVVRPPLALIKRLKPPAKDVIVNRLGPESLSEIFRNDANLKILEMHLATMETEEARRSFYGVFLRCIVPRISDGDTKSLHILQDCRIIPRPKLSLPLGVINFNTTKNSGNHLKTSPLERQQFMFACNWFVNTELFTSSISHTDVAPIVTRDPIADMITAGANIRTINIQDIGIFLSRQDSPTQNWSPNKDNEEWLLSLWSYLNDRFKVMPANLDTKNPSIANTTEDFLTKADLWNKPVYKVVNAQSVRYISPHTFANGAFIVEPDVHEHREICMTIPGLEVVSRACVPLTLAKRERNLELAPSFTRFVGALTKGEPKSIASIKLALNSALNDTHRSALRELLAKYVSNYAFSSDIPNLTLLRCLPIWPRVQRTEDAGLPAHIAADEALFCAHQSMFLEWIQDLKQFVDPKFTSAYASSLPKLGASLMSVKEMWETIQKDLPAKLTRPSALQEHLGLLQQLSAFGIKTKKAFAPNRLGNLCLTESLYDHQEQIFIEAFSQEDAIRFLHPKFRSLRQFFVGNGLRIRGPGDLVKQEDFMECALAVDRQWSSDIPSAVYDRSASVISSYLHLEKQDFRYWPLSNWERISKLRLFLVKRCILGQPIYRQPQMQKVAEEQHHCALNDAARDADVRICWSQCKFVENEPAAFVFSQRPMGSFPYLEAVYRHLKYLVTLHQTVTQADLSEYLQDLQACYSLLQKCADRTKGLPGIRSAKIWFNLESTETNKILKEQLANKLLPSHLLCLDAPCEYHNHRVK